MIGAIVGDIVGSSYAWNDIVKAESLFSENSRITGNTIQMLAVAKSINEMVNPDAFKLDVASNLKRLYSTHLGDDMYSVEMAEWLNTQNRRPIPSYNAESAIRCVPCGIAGKYENKVIRLADMATEAVQKSQQANAGAEAVSIAMFMTRNGASAKDVKDRIENGYYPIKEIKKMKKPDSRCDTVVPVAISAFLGAGDFIEALINVINKGGRCDLAAPITCALAEAKYGVPDELENIALSYLDSELYGILSEFETRFVTNNDEVFHVKQGDSQWML